MGKLLHNVTSTKIHGQYAKACEVDKKYLEAAKAYEAAKEYECAIRYLCAIVCSFNFIICVRLYLDNLQLPDEAVRIVKEQNSIEGAKMVAKYVLISLLHKLMFFALSFFQKLGDIPSALNFLVLSQCQEEAFAMAQVKFSFPLLCNYFWCSLKIVWISMLN